MKNHYLNLILAAIVLASGSVSWAQYGTGGGREKELALKQMMLDLIPYLESSAGQADFPEVRDYNKAVIEYNSTHPNDLKETVSDLLRNTPITFTAGAVFDSFDKDRDCVSHFEDFKHRYIECDNNAKLDPADLNSQPSLYAFLFHEALVQAGIEKPQSKEVQSDYHVSGRMKFHKQTFEKMMPGAATTHTFLKPTVPVRHANCRNGVLANTPGNAFLFCFSQGFTKATTIVTQKISCSGMNGALCYVEDEGRNKDVAGKVVIEALEMGQDPFFASIEHYGYREMDIIASVDCE